eukprot:1789252-Rhodomonas_salina.8
MSRASNARRIKPHIEQFPYTLYEKRGAMHWIWPRTSVAVRPKRRLALSAGCLGACIRYLSTGHLAAYASSVLHTVKHTPAQYCTPCNTR